jgi:hypothetical protein
MHFENIIYSNSTLLSLKIKMDTGKDMNCRCLGGAVEGIAVTCL